MASTPEPLRVLLVDLDRFFREGLRRSLDGDGIAVVGEPASGAQAAAMTRELLPGVVVIDHEARHSSRVDAVAQIISEHPQVQVVILGVSPTKDAVLDALASGACSYLLKSAPVGDLVAGIRLAGGGHAVFSHEVVRELALMARTDQREALERRTAVGGLTARELDVVRLIARGADNASIGRELSISGNTVKQHVTRVFAKLGVENRVQAAVSAIRAGLV